MNKGVHFNLLTGIPNIKQYLSHDCKHIRFIGAGDFPCHNDRSFRSKHLTCHSGPLILFQTHIQDCICNLVTQFVRVSFSYRFCCIKFSHMNFLSFMQKRQDTFLLREHILPDYFLLLSFFIIINLSKEKLPR